MMLRRRPPRSSVSRGKLAAQVTSHWLAALAFVGVIGAPGLVAADTGGSIANDETAFLGDAPRRDVSQDISGWRLSPQPKVGTTRDQIVQLYNGTYVPGNAATLIWTGAVTTCDAGTTNLDHQQAVIARINYFRALVGLPAVALINGAQVAQEQAAALMMTANNALNHFPPTSWMCYSADGANAAGSSNIALGLYGVKAIDLYMSDPGANNSAGGHRRWILFPPQAAMATGETTGDVSHKAANALYVFGPLTTRPVTPNGVAWPPAGFVPYQNLPAASNRWSFSFPGGDFSNATVTMSGPGGTLAVTLEPIANGYGDNTIVFLPTGATYAQPTSDTTYTITVSGMTGVGVPSTVQYTVTVIDPAATGSPPVTTVDVIEFYNATLDHYFISIDGQEIHDLDTGVHPGWARSGLSFEAYAVVTAGANPVCRFYIPPGYGDSHFFSASPDE